MKWNRSHGGYLSVGKLTAKLEKKAESSNAESPIPNPSPLSTIHYPLFTINTPTATVTDLGTEFGVEVGESGVTAAHVFRGTVEVQPAADGDEPKWRVVQLVQNESVRIERRQGSNEAKVYRGQADAAAFVRSEQLRKLVEEQGLEPLRRWQAYSRQLRKDPALVAYYPFESVGKDSWLLTNVAATGAALDGEIQGPLWTSGRLPSKVALRFRGPGTGDKVVLPEPAAIQLHQPVLDCRVVPGRAVQDDCVPALIAKGGVTWRLERWGTSNSLTIDTAGNEESIHQASAAHECRRSSLASGRCRGRAA